VFVYSGKVVFDDAVCRLLLLLIMLLLLYYRGYKRGVSVVKSFPGMNDIIFCRTSLICLKNKSYNKRKKCFNVLMRSRCARLMDLKELSLSGRAHAGLAPTTCCSQLTGAFTLKGQETLVSQLELSG